MKVYLDDVRTPPSECWVLVKTSADAIILLETGQVTHLSLDHDLGDDCYGNGYIVACWLENKVATDATFVLPDVTIHSANPVGRAKMQAALDSAKKIEKSR